MATENVAVFGQVAGWLSEARSAVIFTGAGISTESGIPDFRSPNGVWARNTPVYYQEFLKSASARFEYWRQKAEAAGDFEQAEPNVGHRVLAKWESADRVRGVITQNIDGLHQIAGSRRVLELHGTARWVSCLDCQARFELIPLLAAFRAEQAVPDCPNCGGMLKSATISFGQPLPTEILDESTDWASESDLFLAVGSSLVVHPAAGLPALARRSGAKLVIINRDPTDLDPIADAVIRTPIGEALSQIDAALN